MAAFGKWDLIVGGLVLASWTAFVEVPIVLVQHGEVVPGIMKAAYVVPAPATRSRNAPVVVLDFTYRVGDRTYPGSSLYQPAGDAPTWTESDRIAAEAFIASHPPGSPLQVRTSRFVPWAGRPEPPTHPTASRGAAVVFGFIFYGLFHFCLRVLVDRLYLWFRDMKRSRLRGRFRCS